MAFVSAVYQARVSLSDRDHNYGRIYINSPHDRVQIHHSRERKKCPRRYTT